MEVLARPFIGSSYRDNRRQPCRVLAGSLSPFAKPFVAVSAVLCAARTVERRLVADAAGNAWKRREMFIGHHKEERRCRRHLHCQLQHLRM